MPNDGSKQQKIFTSNLNYYLQQTDKTQKEIAASIGTSPQTFNTWCQGIAIPRMGKIQALADYFKINKSDLIEERKPKTPTGSNFNMNHAEMKHIEKYRDLDSHGQEMVDLVLQKEYDRCQLKEDALTYTAGSSREIGYYQRLASAGTGQVIFDGVPVDRIRIPDTPKYKRVAYAVGVNGSSMEPLYSDNDILLVEPAVQIEVGEIGIFIVEGEAYVKKLGQGTLISLNADYGDIPLTESSRCMGRVVDKLEL